MVNNMNEENKAQLLKDISLLINEGIGVIYSGDGRWSHNFDLIFNKFLIKIELSFDLTEISIDICEGIACNSISYTTGDSCFGDLLSVLQNKFSLDNVSTIVGFLDEMENYKNGDLEILNMKMERFLKMERFEDAEKLRIKMENIKKNKK